MDILWNSLVGGRHVMVFSIKLWGKYMAPTGLEVRGP